jgi:hypothetical protein
VVGSALLIISDIQTVDGLLAQPAGEHNAEVAQEKKIEFRIGITCPAFMPRIGLYSSNTFRKKMIACSFLLAWLYFDPENVQQQPGSGRGQQASR